MRGVRAADGTIYPCGRRGASTGVYGAIWTDGGRKGGGRKGGGRTAADGRRRGYAIP